ncbi:MAG: hypothetical protein WD399_04915 [Thermoleophilaceae bacterium]
MTDPMRIPPHTLEGEPEYYPFESAEERREFILRARREIPVLQEKSAKALAEVRRLIETTGHCPCGCR